MNDYKGFRQPFFGGCRYFCSCGDSVELLYPPGECEPVEEPDHVKAFWALHKSCPIFDAEE